MTLSSKKPTDSPAQPAQAVAAAPALPPDLQNAAPLLLSVTVDASKPEPDALAQATESGGHVVRRHINADDPPHVYHVIAEEQSEITFQCFFVPPAGSNAPSLTSKTVRDGVVVPPAGGAGATPGGGGGSPVAHGATPTPAAGSAPGSPVAHGGTSPTKFVLNAGAPDYYFIISVTPGQAAPDAPYTFAVAAVS